MTMTDDEKLATRKASGEKPTEWAWLVDLGFKTEDDQPIRIQATAVDSFGLGAVRQILNSQTSGGDALLGRLDSLSFKRGVKVIR